FWLPIPAKDIVPPLYPVRWGIFASIVLPPKEETGYEEVMLPDSRRSVRHRRCRLGRRSARVSQSASGVRRQPSSIQGCLAWDAQPLAFQQLPWSNRYLL